MSQQQTLTTHPIASIVPLMPDAQMAELTEDIERNGLLDQIALFEGKILDGRARYLACLTTGRKVETWDFIGTSAEAMDYVLSTNLMRRHLSKAQRAALVVDAQEWRILHAAKNHGGKRVKGESEGRTRTAIAKVAGVSEGYVAEATQIKRQSPEVFDRLKAGALSMAAARSASGKSQQSLSTSQSAPVTAMKLAVSEELTKARNASLPRTLSLLNAELIALADIVHEHGAGQLVRAAHPDDLRLLADNVQRALAALALIEQAMNDIA